MHLVTTMGDGFGILAAMKNTILILVACTATIACAKVVGPVPLEDAVFADTEASTNVPPPVCTSDQHVFSFTMDFAGSSSNAVEIAFGVDADADGTLAPDEARLVVGWDCAAWFVRNETEGETVWEPSAVSRGAQSLSVLVRVGREGCPTSFVVHGGNAPLFTGLASTPPAWLHDCSWNLCRITSRGVGSHDASFLVSSSPDGLKVIMR